MSIDIDSYYRQYAPMVLRRCRSLMHDEELALDMMQDVFATLIRQKDNLVHAAPSSLLYTMATNTCLNALRSRQSRRKYATDMPGNEDGEFDLPSHDRSYEAVEARDLLDQIFAQDDEKTRTIAWFHYVDRLSLEETAESVGMSVSGIRKRLRRLQTIAATMGGLGA